MCITESWSLLWSIWTVEGEYQNERIFVLLISVVYLLVRSDCVWCCPGTGNSQDINTVQWIKVDLGLGTINHACWHFTSPFHCRSTHSHCFSSLVYLQYLPFGNRSLFVPSLLIGLSLGLTLPRSSFSSRPWFYWLSSLPSRSYSRPSCS